MSIKIYYGYRFKAPEDMAQLILICRLLKDELTIVRNRLVKKIWDHDGDYKDNFMELQRKVWEAENGHRRMPLLDFSFDVTFFPLGDYILAIPYTEHEELRTRFAEVFNAKEYGYWNNVDKPEDVTDEEWEQRYEDWSKILLDIDMGIPSECGLNYTALRWELPFPKDLESIKPL